MGRGGGGGGLGGVALRGQGGCKRRIKVFVLGGRGGGGSVGGGRVGGVRMDMNEELKFL